MRIYVSINNVRMWMYKVELEYENASSLKYRSSSIYPDKNGYRCGHERTNIQCCILAVIWKSAWFNRVR